MYVPYLTILRPTINILRTSPDILRTSPGSLIVFSCIPVAQATPGTVGKCHHEVAMVDLESRRFFQMADVDKKLVISLPLDELGR